MQVNIRMVVEEHFSINPLNRNRSPQKGNSPQKIRASAGCVGIKCA